MVFPARIALIYTKNSGFYVHPNIIGKLLRIQMTFSQHDTQSHFKEESFTTDGTFSTRTILCVRPV